MQVYEKINLLLREKNMSKKEFATRLRNLFPQLNSTGEPPAEKSIYAYLNGRIGIKIELIPYISEVLNIPEQILFDDTPRGRMKFLKHITQSATSIEQEFLRSLFSTTQNKTPKDIYNRIEDLLPYAPDQFLTKLEKTLLDYKSLTDKFTS